MAIKRFFQWYVSFVKAALRPPLVVVVCSMLVIGPYVRAQMFVYELVQRKETYGNSLARAGAAMLAEFVMMAFVAVVLWPKIKRSSSFYGFAWLGLLCSAAAECAFFIKCEAAWPSWVVGGIGSGLLLAVAAKLVSESEGRGKIVAGILSSTSLLAFVLTLIIPGSGDARGLLFLHAALIVFLIGSVGYWKKLESEKAVESAAPASRPKVFSDVSVVLAALSVAASVGVLAASALLGHAPGAEQEAAVDRILQGLGFGVVGSLVFEFAPGNQKAIARVALSIPVLGAALGLLGGEASFYAVSLISVAAFYLQPWLCERLSPQASSLLLLSVVPVGIGLGSWSGLTTANDLPLHRLLICMPVFAAVACVVVARKKRFLNSTLEGELNREPMPNHA